MRNNTIHICRKLGIYPLEYQYSPRVGTQVDPPFYGWGGALLYAEGQGSFKQHRIAPVLGQIIDIAHPRMFIKLVL